MGHRRKMAAPAFHGADGTRAPGGIHLPGVCARGKHLGEFTCREFAREGRIAITCLRLGKIGQPDDNAAQPPDPTWLALADAVHAFECALAAPAEPWAIYHIQSAFPEARFGAGKARDGIGFAPRSDGAGGAG